METYINGVRIAKAGKALFSTGRCKTINNFSAKPVKPDDFAIIAKSDHIRVIEAHDGALVTTGADMPARIVNQNAESDTSRDLLKIAIVNRYQDRDPAIGFIRHFGIKDGAIASSVGHDSHNIVVVGTSDAYMAEATNLIISQKGGIAAVGMGKSKLLPLPIAGIMSDEDGYRVAKAYSALDAFAKEKLGSRLSAPFMTLSFMALLVIPRLKLSDKGLFDGSTFRFVDLFIY
jgi:adenine deaminase